MNRPRPIFDLFIISLLILFLELACIRWFPAHVAYFSFFTNTVMLACFVGMSVGCMIARHKIDHIRQTPIRLAMVLCAGLLVETFHGKLMSHIDVGNQKNPDVVFFGTETNVSSKVDFAVPIEVMLAVFYFLIAIMMVGPGQELGRAFDRVRSSRSTAYAVNLLGSILGIILFAGFSKFSLPPVVWFGASTVILIYVISRLEPDPTRKGVAAFVESPIFCSIVIIGVTSVTSGLFNGKEIVSKWSPYYRIQMTTEDRVINTNMIGHQTIHPMSEGGGPIAYDLPYLFGQATVLGVFGGGCTCGAGSGNDVARACKWAPPDAKIDAVEIDPEIQNLGRKYNQKPKHTQHSVYPWNEDGRNFLRRADAETYDLVIFALVDSLVLHSGANSLRLESYLFTKESFEEVHRVLKPDGMAAVYNFFRQGWIVARLRNTIRDIYQAEPVVVPFPPKEHIDMSFDGGMITAFFFGEEKGIAPLRDAFKNGGNNFWVEQGLAVNKSTPFKFGVKPPDELQPIPLLDGSGQLVPFALHAATVEEDTSPNTPQTHPTHLYTHTPSIPGLTWRGIALVVVLSLGVWLIFRKDPGRNSQSPATEPADGTNGDLGICLRSFFLGAGFMLIETKALVQMALLFGSTWETNTIVFSAVLIMSLAGNWLAGRLLPKNLVPYYLGLFAAIAVGLFVPVNQFLGSGGSSGIALACLITFAPVAFAGVIFATSFGRAKNPDRMFGANVAGALAGALLENLSVVLGFRLLLCVAAGVYLLSALFGSGDAKDKNESYNGKS